MDVSPSICPPTPSHSCTLSLFPCFSTPCMSNSFHVAACLILSCCRFASQGGDLGTVTDTHMPRLYLLQWLKSDRALMMLFNDGTFQVATPSFTEQKTLTTLMLYKYDNNFYFFLSQRSTSTTITQRSFCVARGMSTCWHTLMRNGSPKPINSARCWRQAAPLTCTNACYTPSTCFCRGAAKATNMQFGQTNSFSPLCCCNAAEKQGHWEPVKDRRISRLDLNKWKKKKDSIEPSWLVVGAGEITLQKETETEM